MANEQIRPSLAKTILVRTLMEDHRAQFPHAMGCKKPGDGQQDRPPPTELEQKHA